MKCPGQDTQYWKPGAIFDATCPECGKNVEFFKDDTTRKCGHCGHRFVNPQMDFGCAAYCQYAEQCLGTLPEELLAQKEDLLKDRVAIEVKRHFRQDFRRIGSASRVARYAQRIGIGEMGNMAVILSAAYLHDIGGNENGPHETGGPAIAEGILRKLSAKQELIDAVCAIVDRRDQPVPQDSIEIRVVYDAVLIARIEEKQKESASDPEEISELIERSFFTDSGRREARRVLLASS